MAIQNSSTLNDSISSLKTLPELFAWRSAQTPTAEAYRQFDEASGQWVSTTWQAASQRVAQFINALARLNLERGARVAILLPNSLDAVCIDQAVLALAHVPVPMHALDNPASIAYILQDSGASMLIVDSDQQWQGIAHAGLDLTAIRQVVVTHNTLPVADTSIPVLQLDAWLASAGAQDQIPDGPHESDLAALVYTSGTTGKPKGVMLTHLNVMSNVKAAVQRVAPVSSDVFLSFLPLSHTFERTDGYYLPVAAGACVAYSRSTKQLPQDLLAVRF